MGLPVVRVKVCINTHKWNEPFIWLLAVAIMAGNFAIRVVKLLFRAIEICLWSLKKLLWGVFFLELGFFVLLFLVCLTLVLFYPSK
jgi:hypothetical protein